MPVLEKRRLSRFMFENGHLETLLPAFKKYNRPPYIRERIDTPDGDFLDLDWLFVADNSDSKKGQNLIILSHGLQGSSYSKYIMDSALQFLEYGFDICAWNCRNCSEEINRAQKMYHHGDTEDIACVVDHVIGNADYKNIFLVGFSMGGSINAKFLSIHKMRHHVTAGVSFSTPCDLAGAASTLDRKANRLLKKYFLKSLKLKISKKLEQYPNALPQNIWDEIKTWHDFDRLISAPYNGYSDLNKFYAQGSCKNYLDKLDRPLLLVNALNDPILTESCFPYDIANRNDFLSFLPLNSGGHVYFPKDIRLRSAAPEIAVKYFRKLD